MNVASYGRRADSRAAALAHERAQGTARGQIPGLAHSDMKGVEFLHRSGPPDTETPLDDPARGEAKWPGDRAHHDETA
ncbi:hypothetical protein [Streptomyces sp. NPDC059262]|uniref:hypothetical protein n=1 Tax=Streptomyces sp. NPDC059262 TaxID=3346797 RepID=UPI0036CAE90C